jgi:hypothetical protein
MKATYLSQKDWPILNFEPEKPTFDLAGESITAYTVYRGPTIRVQGNWTPVDQSDYMAEVYALNAKAFQQDWALEKEFKAAFGYAERVSELCQRLEKIESVLLDVVKRLDSSVQQQRGVWVPIESFSPEPYEILRPITAVITPVEDGFEAGLFDAKLFSTGDTEVEALENLKSLILENYSVFEQLGDSQLGPGPLRQWKILASLIRKCES